MPAGSAASGKERSTGRRATPKAWIFLFSPPLTGFAAALRAADDMLSRMDAVPYAARKVSGRIFLWIRVKTEKIHEKQKKQVAILGKI